MDNEKIEPFFDIDRDGKELAGILEKIEEQRLLRSLQGDHFGDVLEALKRFKAPLAPPDPAALNHRIDQLRSLQAPYFVLGGKWLSKLAYLLNLPLFFFGRKQEHFNKMLADILQSQVEQAGHMHAIVDYQRYQDRRISELVAALEKSQALLEKQQHEAQIERKELQQDLQSGDERLSVELRGANEWLTEVSRETRGLNDWLTKVSNETRGDSHWLKVESAKMMRLSMQVRELLDVYVPGVDTTTFEEPRIVDAVAYTAKRALAPEGLSVNLGCGEKPCEGFINVDREELPGVDVVADVRCLPFEEGSLLQISSEHLVEHFRQQQLAQTIIPYWKKLLLDKGSLRIVCPNWQAMIDLLEKGEMPYESFKEITFGAQDYNGDDHFSMYTPETLTTLLKECGFPRVELVATDRMNGACPEMELLAYLS